MYVNADQGNSSEGMSKKDLVDFVKVDMESFGLSREDAQDQWSLKIGGEAADSGLCGKCLLKWSV